MLARLSELLKPAQQNQTAVGAFNVFSLEHAEAIIAGAEAAQLPVIAQISQNAVAYHGKLGPIAGAVIGLAREAAVPVVVHLDHATEHDLLQEALHLGFGSIMYDGSILSYTANLTATRDWVLKAHEFDIAVEAELGEVGGKDGAHAPGARTDPAQARTFVDITDIDALAVAVGSSHAMTRRNATLDLDLLDQLRSAVPVPLVLHGSSGVSDEQLQQAVRAGITKVNMATHLNVVFTNAVRQVLDDEPDLVDSRRYLGPARTAMTHEVSRLLRLLADAS